MRGFLSSLLCSSNVTSTCLLDIHVAMIIVVDIIREAISMIVGFSIHGHRPLSILYISNCTPLWSKVIAFKISFPDSPVPIYPCFPLAARAATAASIFLYGQLKAGYKNGLRSKLRAIVCD